METPTEQNIVKEFVDLYVNKPFAAITVQELCEKAGISKSTFYYYFENLNAVKEYVEDYIYNTAKDSFKTWRYMDLSIIPDSESDPLVYDMLKFVSKNTFYFQALFSDHAEMAFKNKYHQKIEEMHFQKMETLYPKRKGNRLRARILVAIIAESSQELFNSENELAFEEIAQLQTRLSNIINNLDITSI